MEPNKPQKSLASPATCRNARCRFRGIIPYMGARAPQHHAFTPTQQRRAQQVCEQARILVLFFGVRAGFVQPQQLTRRMCKATVLKARAEASANCHATAKRQGPCTAKPVGILGDENDVVYGKSCVLKLLELLELGRKTASWILSFERQKPKPSTVWLWLGQACISVQAGC